MGPLHYCPEYLPAFAGRADSHTFAGGRHASRLETVGGRESGPARGLWPFRGGFGP